MKEVLTKKEIQHIINSSENLAELVDNLMKEFE